MENELINSNCLNESLYNSVCAVLTNARENAYRAINFGMVQAYWQVGRLIVEEEQNGNARAEYGKAIILELSGRLTAEFGKGFDASNLRNMRLFYQAFPNCDALRHELTWTHYRLLLRVEDKKAREWYINEAIAGNWSSRQLDRQISALYYERLLLSKEKEPVMEKQLNRRQKDALQEVLKSGSVSSVWLVKSKELTSRYGRGFSSKNLRYFRNFYSVYSERMPLIRHIGCGEFSNAEKPHTQSGVLQEMSFAIEASEKYLGFSPEPGWSHYRTLMNVENRNETIAKYSVLKESKQIFASKYILQLPTEEELRLEIERERRQIEENHEE